MAVVQNVFFYQVNSLRQRVKYQEILFHELCKIQLGLEGSCVCKNGKGVSVPGTEPQRFAKPHLFNICLANKSGAAVSPINLELDFYF